MSTDTAPRFRREFIEIMGVQPGENDVDLAVTRLGPNADDRSIRDYIVDMPMFDHKYRDLVRRIYSISNEGREPDDNVIRRYMSLFANTPGFMPDDLADAIVKGSGNEGDGSEEELEHAEIDDADNHRPSSPEVMLRFARDWHRYTGTRIDVFEFIRYHSAVANMSEETVMDIVARQAEAMARVNDITTKHLGRTVDRSEFLDNYIFSYDRPEFAAEVLGTVLGSEEYRNGMIDHLRACNKKLFGTAMHDDDSGYAFDSVREKRIPLHSEDITSVVMGVSDQLRTIEEQVNNIYMSVLGRDADALEIREQVIPWRSHGPTACSAVLRENLYNSLEFHDVLKEKIRAKLLKDSKTKVTPRLVFQHLKHVLDSCSGNMSRAMAAI